MRTINADECLLFSAFVRFPELIPAYCDLQRHHFSGEFSWLLYQRFIEADTEKLVNVSAYIVGSDLRKEDLISSEELEFIHDDFGNIPMSYTAEEAYNRLQERFELIRIRERLALLVGMDCTVEELREKASEVLSESVKIDEPMENIQNVTTHYDSSGFDFGMAALDKLLDIEKTDLVIVAGRPFSGKTTFAVQLAMELTRFGKIQFWSMEMSAGRIKEKVDRYGHRYKTENFFIKSPNSTTLQKIYKYALADKPVAIFVDQLNKIQAKGQKEYEQFTNIARGLKELSGKLKIPIFCLAQINRDAQNGRPYLYQLKGSGSIEEESDVVMLLQAGEAGKTMMFLDKNRTKKGHLANFNLSFNMENYIYDDCSQTFYEPK